MKKLIILLIFVFIVSGCDIILQEKDYEKYYIHTNLKVLDIKEGIIVTDNGKYWGYGVLGEPYDTLLEKYINYKRNNKELMINVACIQAISKEKDVLGKIILFEEVLK